jgi:hypothetical protein
MTKIVAEDLNLLGDKGATKAHNEPQGPEPDDVNEPADKSGKQDDCPF